MAAGEGSLPVRIDPSDPFSIHPGPFVGAFPHVEPHQVSYYRSARWQRPSQRPIRRVLPTSAQNKVSFLSQEELVDYFGAKALPEGWSFVLATESHEDSLNP